MGALKRLGGWLGVAIAVIGFSCVAATFLIAMFRPSWAVSPDGQCPPYVAAHDGCVASSHPKPFEVLMPLFIVGGLVAGGVGACVAQGAGVRLPGLSATSDELPTTTVIKATRGDVR